MKKKNKKIINNKIRDLLLNQKGMALLTTLIFVFILVTFAVALLTMTSNDTKLSALQRDSTKAFYIAEAGIERTLYNLKKDFETTQDWDNDIDGAIINGYTLSDKDSYEFRKIGYDGKNDYDVTFTDDTYGGYTVSLKIIDSKNVTIKSKGKYNKSTRYIQIDAKMGELSIWDNAIFAGSGQSGKVINGNVDIRGSVHILGTEGAVAVEALDITGTAGIGNNYDGMDSNIRSRIINPPTTDFNGETGIETLNAKLRVKHGIVNLSGTATVGDPDVSGNEYKETLDGVYIDDGGDDSFGGNQGADNVYSDNGTEQPYDFGEGTFHFPTLDELYIDPETGATFPNDDGNPCSYKEYYDKYGLHLPVDISSITSDTASFHYPDDDIPDTNGNYINWDQDTGELTISGIIVIDGSCIDFAIGKKGDLIEYEGKEVEGTKRRGTIVSKGDISIHSDLLAKNLFPTTDALGLIAYNDINLAKGPGDSQLKMMGAFFAQNKITSAKQNQIAGTFASENFDMGTNVPKIFQVPGLENNLPPGMPGATIIYTMHTSNWHEVYE